MAICNTCGTETTRVRSAWKGDVQLPDECPSCAPQSFDKFKSVRDGQITLGHEYMPTMYKKTDAGYVAKDELTADTEAEIVRSITHSPEQIAYEAAAEKKRHNRRTKPLNQSEIEQAICRWSNMSA